MIEPTVSAGYVNSLLKLAVARGVDRAVLLKRAGLDEAALAAPDNRVAFARFKAMMRATKEMLNDPSFAIYFGEHSDFVEMSIVGLVCQAAATMGEAFEQMNRYARLVVEVEGHESGDRFAIARKAGGGVWLEDRRRNPDDFPELTESTWTRFVAGFTRMFPDRTHYVKCVHMTHAEPADPAYRAEYARIFKMPIVFGSDRNALLIEETWLAQPINTSNRYVFGIFSEHAEALLKSLKQSKAIKGKVESELIPILHTGEVSMDEVAKRLGLSRPTLYRKLKDEGESYEALLDALRHRMALHYLNGQKVSVNQAAYLVGFSDPSAFSRAFKRWTGASPRAAVRAQM
jgi:AraC-like DNA-binding protein